MVAPAPLLDLRSTQTRYCFHRQRTVRFLPLADLYKKRYAMDGPAVPAVPDDCAGSVRIRGLKAFAAAVTGEPFTPVPLSQYDGDTMVSAGQRERSEYSGWSEASGGSSTHMAHDSRPFEIALRQQQPRPQYGRAPPGMGSGGGGVLVPGGERVSRSASGPGHAGTGYFGSGSSLGGGSDGGGRRSSRGAGQGGACGLFFFVGWGAGGALVFWVKVL